MASVAATAAISLVLTTSAAPGSSSVVPATLTKNATTAATLPTSYMLTKAETVALAVSNGGKISLHGGFKTTSAIDPKHKIVLVERVCCARTEFFLFRASKPVVPGTINADLVGLSIKGITIRATDAALFRRFRKNGSDLSHGNGVVQYRVDWNDHCEMTYTFDIEKHVVRGMSARDAC